MSRLKSLTRPWLGPLILQRAMCRALLTAVVILTFGLTQGWKLWPCTFAAVTGLPCPGCGLTRAGRALLLGDWQTALHFHPFSPVFAILGLFVAAGALLPLSWAGKLAALVTLFERKTLITTVFWVGLLCFSLLRMLAFFFHANTP
ncbi:MAG: DUF2752 domain-containing protein [Prosthecobacter sp.]